MTQTFPVTVQSCGCIAVPEEVASSLGITPGTALALTVDAATRSITLTAMHEGKPETPVTLTACPIQA